MQLALQLRDMPLPPGVTTRELLQDSRRGQGRALKQLRQALAARPDIRRRFQREHAAECESTRQRDKLQWARVQGSRVARVDTALRERATFTDPCGTGEIPRRCPCDPAARTVVVAGTTASDRPSRSAGAASAASLW